MPLLERLNPRHWPRTILVTLLTVAALSLHFNWNSWNRSPPPAKNPAAQPSALDHGSEFLQLEYQSAVAEIQERLRQESALFSIKFSIAGLILAFFLGQSWRNRPTTTQVEQGTWNDLAEFDRIRASPLAATFFWSAVCATSIIDTRILFHADVVTLLGNWIRTNVEPVLLGKGAMGWESFNASGTSLFVSPVFSLLWANVHLLTLVLFFGTAWLFGEPPSGLAGSPAADLARISRAGAIISFVVFYLTAIHFHNTQGTWYLLMLVPLAGGVIASWSLWPPPPSGRTGNTP